VQYAVSYGMVFRCDPAAFLDRDESEFPVLVAMLHEADRRMRKQAEEVKRGQR